MPDDKRRCLVCDKDISGRHPSAKTCSRAHKEVLAHRRRRENQKRDLNALNALKGEDNALALAREVLREEIREYISREALTDDVLADIQRMINFAPAAIQVLAQQLASEDELIAQRAAGMILRYTMGNPSVAPPEAAKQPQRLEVVFGAGVTPPPALDGTVEELEPESERTCNACGQTKPASEFVAKSNRCQRCHDRMQLEVAQRFAPKDPTKPADDFPA